MKWDETVPVSLTFPEFPAAQPLHWSARFHKWTCGGKRSFKKANSKLLTQGTAGVWALLRCFQKLHEVLFCPSHILARFPFLLSQLTGFSLFRWDETSHLHVLWCDSKLTSDIIHLHLWLMQFAEPDNCGTIFILGDRWSKWVHRFATLPVGNDIKSTPPVTRQQQAEPTCLCWEHLRPPRQQSSPSSGFVNNSCSLQIVRTIP